MRIEYRTGDFLAGAETLLAHGCNAQGKFNKGVAKAVREAEPRAYDAYMRAYDGRADKRRGLPLGLIVPARCGTRTVFNCVTQEFYGNDPTVRYVSYEAVASVMRKLDERLARTGGMPRLAMPLIGAGLSNGSWRTVSEIIEDESTSFQPVVYLLNGVKPTT